MGKLRLGACPRSATASGMASWGWADPSLTGPSWWHCGSARRGAIVGLQRRESQDEGGLAGQQLPSCPELRKLRGLLQAEVSRQITPVCTSHLYYQYIPSRSGGLGQGALW